MTKNQFVFLVALLLLLPACKKSSKWNPKCWGDKGKEDAVMISTHPDKECCPPHIILETSGDKYSIMNWDKLPKRFRSIGEGDTVEVKIRYNVVGRSGGQWIPCACIIYDYYAEIECIQDRK